MKVTFFILLCFYFTANSFAQDHLGEKYEMYYGAKLKVNLPQKYYDNFFTKYNPNILDEEKFVFRPTKKFKSKTDGAIFNTEFNCIRIEQDKRGVDIFLVLVSEIEKDTCYYKFQRFLNKYDNYIFPFKIIKNGTGWPDEYYCEDFSVVKSDFSSELTYYSPPMFAEYSKKNKNGNITYTLFWHFYSSELYTNLNGLSIKFEDGEILNWPETTIFSNADEKGFKYSTNVSLTKEELDKLSTKTILAYKMGINEGKIIAIYSNLLRHYAICLPKL